MLISTKRVGRSLRSKSETEVSTLHIPSPSFSVLSTSCSRGSFLVSSSSSKLVLRIYKIKVVRGLKCLFSLRSGFSFSSSNTSVRRSTSVTPETMTLPYGGLIRGRQRWVLFLSVHVKSSVILIGLSPFV